MSLLISTYCECLDRRTMMFPGKTDFLCHSFLPLRPIPTPGIRQTANILHLRQCVEEDCKSGSVTATVRIQFSSRISPTTTVHRDGPRMAATLSLIRKKAGNAKST